MQGKRTNRPIKKTQDYEILGRVLIYCKSGWSKTINEDGELKHYWKLKNEIISNEGLLYYKSRLLIPKTLRKYIIHKLHETHLGITKTKARTRQLFYFPDINTQIKNYILSCVECLKFSRSKIKEPMLSHTIPDIPFYKIAIDIAEFGGKKLFSHC